MKAAVLNSVGAPVRVEDLREPRPKEGEILIRVAACGVCHSDLHVAKGDLKFPTPCVLGHEISGTVALLGSGVDGPKVGTRVVASFIMPCGRCGFCAVGRDDLCETYFSMNRVRGVLYDGESRLFRADGTPLAMQMMGGLAEFAVVPATDVFPLPARLPLEESCILGCAIMTAYGGVKHAAELGAGQTVAVVGAGGLGSNVVQMAHVFGAADVIAVDVKNEKLAEVRGLGATYTVNALQVDPVEEVLRLTKGKGVHAAFECLGRPETIAQAFRMTRDGGRAVILGVATAGQTAPIEINRLVRRGIRLAGSFGCRVRTDMPEILKLAAEGKIDVSRPVTRRYRLSQVQEAFDAMEKGEILGRAIVVL